MQITTEITSSKIASDNPLHQRLLYAYKAAQSIVSGNLLEVGCGEGRGIEMISSKISNYTALDKNSALIKKLSVDYPNYKFIETTFPPFLSIADNTFDFVIAFQVIEHIKNDQLFVSEIYRVLKPGGKAIISTPNIDLTLTRNPWHEREYTWEQLEKLMKNSFSKVQTSGITGNDLVKDYYELNKKSVKKITRWDIFDLQYLLPASWLRVPYDILNRRNRNKMMDNDTKLVSEISIDDYSISTIKSNSYDLFYISEK